MTHSEAVSMVRGKMLNKNSRKVGNNTYAEILDDGSVGILLHSTHVVKIHPDNTYTRVYQHKYEWFVKLNGKEYPFIEGMVVGG